jgi:acetone carboxylase gamma subunit
MRRERLERAVPVHEWWRRERARVEAQDFIEAVKVCYAESMRLSARFAAEFRGFWDLPDDFEVEAVTPTVAAQHAQPGKITPEETADEFLAGSEVERVEPPRTGGGTLDRQTLAAMLDEKLSRREVKDIQSGYKDPDRFEKWIAVLSERVPYDDPIVLPIGEGLNVVRSEGELVVRCDCGHDFCPPTRNWKMEAAIYVRDDLDKLLEVYPKMAHCDPEWMELRELYCPSCARQLETEAVPPGYPVVHEFLPDIEGFYRGWLGREVP